MRMRTKTMAVAVVAIFVLSLIGIAQVASTEIKTYTSEKEYVCHICDLGCEISNRCPPETPYLCKRSEWWPWNEKCVAKGYDFGCCGGRTNDGGFLYECDAGCFSQDELDELYAGDCNPNIPGVQKCEEDKYCCRKTSGQNKCVPDGYDYGGCGGPTGEKTLAWLKATIYKTGTSCTSKIKFEVQEKCTGEYKDVSSDCLEGDYTEIEITVHAGESKKITCTFEEIPLVYCARITWCGEIEEFKYGYPTPTPEVSPAPTPTIPPSLKSPKYRAELYKCLANSWTDPIFKKVLYGWIIEPLFASIIEESIKQVIPTGTASSLIKLIEEVHNDYQQLIDKRKGFWLLKKPSQEEHERLRAMIKDFNSKLNIPNSCDEAFGQSSSSSPWKTGGTSDPGHNPISYNLGLMHILTKEEARYRGEVSILDPSRYWKYKFFPNNEKANAVLKEEKKYVSELQKILEIMERIEGEAETKEYQVLIQTTIAFLEQEISYLQNIDENYFSERTPP